jgi:cell division septum initiation protein DivIVA
MAKSGVFIRDVLLLEKLDERIVASGKAMANIEQNVCQYLNDVRKELERQLDVIHQKFQEAEQKLNDAENALSSCRSSQILDPTTGAFVPSCDWAEDAVESAQSAVEKWRTRYEQGQKILEECQREIGEHNGQGGGHSLILTMSEQQTLNVSQLLRGCTDKLQDVLNSNMVVSDSIAADAVPKESDSFRRTNDLKDFFEL